MRMLRMKKTKQNNNSPIEKMSTLNPAHEIYFYCISISRTINPIDFSYLGMIVHTRPQALVQIYVTHADSFGRFSVMSNIQVYFMVCWCYWYARVTGKNYILVGFTLYPRYSHLLTIAIGTYRRMLILAPYPFLFDSIA